MTALNILLERHRVCIAMDTLVARSGQPWRFTSKLLPLPHLDGAMCGTGSLRFIGAWLQRLQIEVLAPDLVALDPHVPGALRLLARDHYVDDGNSTTIYHFGLDRGTGHFRGFAYRSRNGFCSEALPYGLLLKPPLDGPHADPQPEDLVTLMERQKVEDRVLPPREQAGIGGEIHLLTLTPGCFELRRVQRFADYAEDYRAMLRQAEG